MRIIKLFKKIGLLRFAAIAAVPIVMHAQQSKVNLSLEEVALPVSTRGWYDFRSSNTLTAQTLFTDHKHLFKLGANDEMRETKVETDNFGYTHTRFQQYHNRLKIEGAEAIAHYNGKYLKSMNGSIVENMTLSNQPKVTESAALNIAMQSAGTKDFVWNKIEIAESLKKLNKDIDFSNAPTAELMYCRKNWNGDFALNNISLAYKVRLMTVPIYESKDVYIDANTGAVLHINPLQTNCNPSNGNTNWYGNQTVWVSYHGWPHNTYFLETQCSNEPLIRSRRGDPIIPYNYGDADGVFTDADGTNGYNQRSGTTTMIGITESYLYFKNNHGRNSYDNANGTVDAYSEITGGLWLPTAENASWNPITHHMSFGAGATGAATDDWNCYDIAGHEFTHGVHQYATGFNYSGEPGALDESFADIFGELIEAQAKGLSTPNWLMGADRSFHIRNLSNPNDNFDPDTYQGTYWQNTSNSFDNYGVHTNSSVQNFWFYLLAMGGSGTNDLGVNYAVTGIGITEAAMIAYRNMEVYLTSSSTYVDAREGAIHAANDLFGACSNQAIQCGRAWHAVGVANYSPAYDKFVPCGNIANGNYIRAVNSITTQNCATTALNGTDTRMIAVNTITLVPGFTAQAGSSFGALLDECSYAAFSKLSNSNTVRGNALLSSTKVNESDISLFPNPANQQLTLLINTPELTLANVELTDLAGRKVLNSIENITLKAGEQKINLDVSKLEVGTYLCVIRFDKTIITKKVIVNH